MQPKPVLSDEVLDLAANRFRLLGDPVRLRLLQALEGGEQTVGDLVEVVGGSQPNISRHLLALHEGGLLARRREGNCIYYWIGDPVVLQLCSLVCGTPRE